jgi:PAS domain S-box-containing protein
MPDPTPRDTSTDAAGELRAERDRFAAFALAASDLLIEVNGEERIVYVVGAARALTGRDARQLMGSPFRELFAEPQRDFARTLLRRVRRDQRMTPVKIDLDRSGGSTLSVVLNGCCLPEKPNALYFTASRAAAPGAADAAQRDAATGLLAGPAFQAAAAAALNDPARGDLTLTLLDIAGIDELRSRDGEGAVTRLLGEIGDFLAAHAVDGASAGRLAPDRFALVRDAAKSADLERGIERLSPADGGTGPGLRVKQQAVPLAAGGLTPADAERALAYTLGRFAEGDAGPIRSLADGFRELVVETVARISRTRSSLSQELTIVFQPVVGLEDRRLHHYEVLSRFKGAQSPAALVQFAECVGMIEELDLTVCQSALAALDSWQESSELTLAVNLSGRSLGSDAFIGALQALLKPRSDQSRLLFEITETTEIADLPRAQRIIQEFRRAGHKVGLDDFGAGAASFPYLQALTIDFVKIDGAYVGRMLDTPRDHAILKAMVGLCGDLSIATIAEMIETEAQAERLTRLGVRYGQGYLFGRPAPTPAVADTAVRKVPPKSTVFARRKGPVQTWG